jgi:hypothetical protein
MYEYLLIPVCFDKNQQDDTVDGNTSHGWFWERVGWYERVDFQYWVYEIESGKDLDAVAGIVRAVNGGLISRKWMQSQSRIPYKLI